MGLVLPRFYAILDRSLRPDLLLGTLARTLLEAGVTLIQLRAKQAPSGQLLAQAGELLSLLPSQVRLVVNDRADVAWLSGAAGLHVGQDDLPVGLARALLGPDRLIGFSTHNLEQLESRLPHGHQDGGGTRRGPGASEGSKGARPPATGGHWRYHTGQRRRYHRGRRRFCGGYQRLADSARHSGTAG
jgi:thiamine-phosphate pyrophosphorylase